MSDHNPGPPVPPPYQPPVAHPVDESEVLVDGELVDPPTPLVADDLGVIDGEVLDGVADETDELDDDSDGHDGDVMVLDSWQIELPATGDATVDAAIARLAEVESLPPAAHAEVYEAVHAGLREALADLDRS